MAKRQKQPVFNTSDDSAFADKYDIAAERIVLKELIESDDPKESHPLWDRYMMLLEREAELEKRKSISSQRSEADALVPDHQAVAMRNIGRLVSDESDVMEVHTREAYRLFIGRQRDETRKYGITSAKRVASILRSLWNLSVNDNPYADWFLIAVTNQIEGLRKEIDAASATYMASIDELKAKGFRIGVLKSQNPVEVAVEFRSPYGYMMAELVMDFDTYVRLVKTMVVKNRLSDDEAREAIRKFNRMALAIFESSLPWQKYLLIPELSQLNRGDFLPSASEEGKKRAAAAEGMFGPVPKEIFTGDIKPRHSKRRVDLSEAELRLLREVAQEKVNELEDEAVGDATNESELL